MFRVALAALAALLLFGDAAHAADGKRQCTLSPRLSTRDVEVVLGEVRRYRVHIGRAARDPAPVLIVFHAWGGKEASLATRLDPDRYWPEAVVIAPEGLPRMLPQAGPRRRPGWQFVAGEYDDRDIAFFDALLEDVTEHFCVDPDRVSAAGYSNGGYFVNLLGCLRGDRLAGVAPVASGGPPDDVVCTGSLPVMIQHGRDDDVIPLIRGLESFGHWTGTNRCEAPPDELPRGCSEAKGCAVTTRFCLNLVGHGWPHGTSERIVEFLRARDRRDPRRLPPPSPRPAATPDAKADR